MTNNKTNLFIVDDNKLMVADLRHYLQNRFGESIAISTFETGELCLKQVTTETDIVILDYYLEGKNGLEILKSIKEINPKTEVIILSANEEMAIAIESFRRGATDYVVKGRGSWKKITGVVTHILTEPLRILVREFGVTKFMAAFILTFLTMGVIVFFVVQNMS